MNKRYTMIALLASSASLLSAEMNAHIEVKLFKTWVIEGEVNFGNIVVKNTGTVPLPIAKNPAFFDMGQLTQSKFGNEGLRESGYKGIERHGGGFISLPPGETHVYEGYKFHIENPDPSSDDMHFTFTVYFGNGVWIDSEPVNLKQVVPDSKEYLATIHNKKNNTNDLYKMVAVTYRNERWLYKSATSRIRNEGDLFFPVCPLSLTNKIRVESHDDESLFKIWDGEKSMIYHLSKSILLEGPDENNVLGKWTRERKQKAEADNAEVRHKKAEEQK